jgi:hypothetical protein
MKWFKDNSTVDNNVDTRMCDIASREKIVCGKFVDVDHPSYLEITEAKMASVYGRKRWERMLHEQKKPIGRWGDKD